jgi:hypothetical protein
MYPDAVERQAHHARLIADLRTTKIELLSAQCAADRLRLRYSVHELVSLGERKTVEQIIASVQALARYVSQIEAELHDKD